MRARYLISTLLILTAFVCPRGAEARQIQVPTNAGHCYTSTGYDAAATSIVVVTGCGATMPTASTNYAWCNVTDYPVACKNASSTIDPNYEIVACTRSSDTLTCTRAQEGTSASTKNTGGKAYILSPLTAKTFTDINTALGATYLTTSSNSVLTNENSGLTAGRVPYMATGPVVADDSEFAWDASDNILKLSSAWTWPNEAFGLQLQRTVLTPPTAAGGCCNGVQAMALLYGRFAQSGSVSQQRVGTVIDVGDDSTVVDKAITGAVSDGGEIQITATAHGFANGDRINVYNVGGTTEANGVWTIEAVATNTFRLDGSTFTNTYTSGGTATNRGLWYGLSINLNPTIDRTGSTLQGTGVNGDDVAGITINNAGQTAMSTDGVWVTDAGTAGRRAYHSILSSDSGTDKFLAYSGKVYDTGIDLSGATLNAGTEPMIKLGSGHNIDLDAAGNGTKIGTSTSDKLGFFNATPIAQNTSTTDLRTGLINLGLFASGGASPLNLNGGALTAAAGTFSGNLTVDTDSLFVDATANRVGIGITSSMLGPLHVANDATDNHVTMDRYNASTSPALLVARKARGTQAAPRRAKTSDVLFNALIQGAGAADDSSTATFSVNSAAFRAVALEDFTNSANGAQFEIRTTPAGSTTIVTRTIADVTGWTIGSSVAARSTTQPTNALSLYDGTAPAGTLTNGVQFYSASGEARVMDAAGNWTQLSPHDTATNEWVYFSVNTETGKVLRVDMERLMRRLDAMLGGGFVTEFLVEPGAGAADVPMQGRLVPSVFPWAMFNAAVQPQGVR